VAFRAGAGDEITLNGRFMLYPPGRAAAPACRSDQGKTAHERTGCLRTRRPVSRLGLVLGLRAVNARVGAKRLALGVCIADAKTQNGQRNEDHGLHRYSPIYRRGEMPRL
jgi:hypothetical protein